jgi:ABC-type microcin C transport system permease subunit YejB
MNARKPPPYRGVQVRSRKRSSPLERLRKKEVLFMKRIAMSLTAVAAVLAIAPAAAQAAPWQSINQRQANLEQRIDQGVRSGQLTRREAVRLRSEFAALDRLEMRYRRNDGRLDPRERADLNRRYDQLSAEVRLQKHDYQRR